MKKHKKIAALLLAAAFAVMTTACGGSASSASSSSAAQSEESQGAPSSQAASQVSSRPEGYPSKDITWIMPFPAGGTNDVWFRLLAEQVKKMEGWEYSFVTEIQEGASGDIGWSALSQAEPDGYTIGFCPTAMLITSISMGRPYGTDKIDYISSMMNDPGVIGVSAASGYNTMQELIQAATDRPGEVSIGVTSVSGSEGLAIKQIEQASGCKFNVIPFDGETEILTAVVGGHCDSFCLNVSDGRLWVEEGSIRYLATGAEERSEFYPDVPTYQECGYDVTQVNCRAIGCPEGTDPAIIQYLSDCFVAASNSEEIKEKAAEMQIPLMAMNTQEVTAFFEETESMYKELWATSPWQ